jgi:hypothetical protein
MARSSPLLRGMKMTLKPTYSTAPRVTRSTSAPPCARYTALLYALDTEASYKH